MASPTTRRRLTRRRVLVLAAVAAVVLPALGYAALAVQTRDAPRPASLPARPEGPGGPASRIDGVWAVSAEPHVFVGYRVREKLGPLPAPDDAVGRTGDVSGRMEIAGSQIRAARITANLATLKSDAAPRDGALRQEGLESDRFPTATFALAAPLDLGPARPGRVLKLQALGRLRLHGVTRSVPVALTLRWNGDLIDVAGRTVIRLADFGMTMSQRVGLRIADRGTLEFELTFRRPARARPAGEQRADSQPGEPDQIVSPDRRQLAREPVSHRPGRLLVIAGPTGDLTNAYAVGADGSHPVRIAPPKRRNGALTPSELALAPERTPGTVLVSRMLVAATGEPAPPRIYRLTLATKALRPLTPGGVRADLPAESPQGDRIAYARGLPASDRTRIYVARRDGSGARPLPRVGSSDDGPAWSPDGRRIAFTCFGADEDVCVVGADGRGARRVTRGPSYDAQPSWSPDGRRLAFSRDGDVYTVDPDGRHLRRLTRGARRRDTAPAWSPDGGAIAFVRADAPPDGTFAGPGRVMIVRPDGRGLVRVRTRLRSVQMVAWR